MNLMTQATQPSIKEYRKCATPTQNAANRSKARNKSSRYKGVSYWKPQNRWKASIKVDGVFMYLGSFESEVDAANAYRDAAYRHLGRFACVPEPDSSVVKL